MRAECCRLGVFRRRVKRRVLTLELGEGGRCGGIDQGEGQVLQGGVELSVDLQHQAEP